MFLKDFQGGKWVGGIKSPKHVQSPEMIRQSRRIPGLFHITEAASILFCPEQTGQSKQKTRRVFAAFPGTFTKTQHAKARQGNLCNVQMPAHEMMHCFPSATSVPVRILTPNPTLHTQVGLQDGALKTVVWPSAEKRLPACVEGRQHLRWRTIQF